MECQVTEQQLWSWIDREAPELEAHLADCPHCRAIADQLRAGIDTVMAGCAAPDLPLPERVGPYAIHRRLGEGGQAVVYEAEQPSPRRLVALKVLKGGCFAGERDVRCFQREIQSLASLQHPAIATIYEAGYTDEGQHFLAMELVRGEPLDTYVRDGRVPLPQRLELFCRICDAVHYAHQRGVIHRDLKPANVLVDGEGNPKILDFGLARLRDSEAVQSRSVTRTGQILGTLAYMSPEQARGQAQAVGVQSDVYALGVILYELLTDRRPYLTSTTTMEAVRTICEVPPLRPGSVNRALRGDLETIALTVLEKEPARRYASVTALSEDIRRYLAGEPIRARPPSSLYLLRTRVRKHGWRVGLLATAFGLGLAGLAAGVWWQQRVDDRDRAREQHAAEQRRTVRHAEARATAVAIQRDLELGPASLVFGSARALFEASPDVPETFLVWGQACIRAARELASEVTLDGIIRSLQGRIAHDPADWASRALLAEVYRITNDPQADALESEAERLAPDTADGWYLRSFTTLTAGQAVAFLESAVAMDPAHVLAWTRLAHASLAAQDYDTALRAARHLSNLESPPSHWLTFAAHIQVRRGRYREAVEQYTAAIDVDPSSATPYLGRGVARLALKDYAGAVDDYTQACTLRGPNYPWARYQRATALWILGQLEEAAADYRATRAVLGRPSFADVRLFLVLQERARHAENPDDTEVVHSLAEARQGLEAARRGTQAGSWLNHVLRCVEHLCDPAELVAAADPQNLEQLCEGYSYAGEICLLAGRRDEAQRWFQRCVDTGLAVDPDTWPPDPMNEYHLAVWRLDQQATEASTGSLADQP